MLQWRHRFEKKNSYVPDKSSSSSERGSCISVSKCSSAYLLKIEQKIYIKCINRRFQYCTYISMCPDSWQAHTLVSLEQEILYIARSSYFQFKEKLFWGPLWPPCDLYCHIMANYTNSFWPALYNFVKGIKPSCFCAFIIWKRYSASFCFLYCSPSNNWENNPTCTLGSRYAISVVSKMKWL